VLREAGLVRDTVSGREREYVLALDALAPLEAFLAQLRGPSVGAAASMRSRPKFTAFGGGAKPRAGHRKQGTNQNHEEEDSMNRSPPAASAATISFSAELPRADRRRLDQRDQLREHCTLVRPLGAH